MHNTLEIPLDSPDLAHGRLSAWETLGQSLASVAPTASPAMVVPLVIAASGKASWLAYLLATLGIACIASQINQFAVRSVSSGSLYTFVHESLGRWPSLIAGWALFIAYAGTAAAVTGGFTSYLFALTGHTEVPHAAIILVLTVIGVGLAGFLAYRDVQMSARLMLWMELFSIALIVFLFVYPGNGSALHIDFTQIRLKHTDLLRVRGGLVLAIFSFVGFESAATLGAESVNPIRNIPRAIRFTALASGLFFILSAYAENAAFGDGASRLQESVAPLQLLANLRGLSVLAPLLSIGSVLSFFACTLACITAGARTLFSMSRDGYLPRSFGRAHRRNQTPHIAVVVVLVATAVPALVLSARGVAPFDLYGWVGTVATYGFITVYFVVTISAIARSVRERIITVTTALSGIVALAVLAVAAWSSFDTSAPAPLRWLPYVYLTLLLAGVASSAIIIARRPAPTADAHHGSADVSTPS